MIRLILWWERIVTAALGASLGVIGIGRLESASGSGSISAWSISRTTFFFWILLKLTEKIHQRRWPCLTGYGPKLAPLCVFFLVITGSLFPDFHAAGDYRYFVFACLHAVMVVDLVRDEQRLLWALMMLGVLPAILVFRGLIHDPAVLSFDPAYRFGFPLDHPNTAGFVLAMTLPLGLWCVTRGNGWRRAIAVVSCLLQMLALILTYSRAAWVGATLASLAYLISCRQWKLVAAILAFCCAIVVVVPALRDRLFSLATPWSDASLSERIMLLREASAIGWNNPILGVGYGRGRVKAALRGRLRGSEFENNPLWHTHNVYVELFAGAGLLGLGSFLWMIGSGFAQAAGSAAQDASADGWLGFALASSWLAMVLCGFGDVPFFHHETRILLFTLFGLIVGSSAIARTQIHQKHLE